jgi:1-acyl-sn-glycerol-3-phosphate acyltransferase
MKNIWVAIRSVVLWAILGLYFFTVGAFLILLGVFVDPAKNDRPQRWLFRNVVRLAGMRLAVQRSPGFDPSRTSIFICNHINLFDPFVVYSAIPQFVRGVELESHFKIPVYGWMMGRFGNIPVPDNPTREGLARMSRLADEALACGTSLLVFAEGGRTRDGHMGPFKNGAFRLAVRLGAPIVPMSMGGAFEFFRTGGWRLYPGEIEVHLFDTIETTGLTMRDVESLRDRVREIIAAPLGENTAVVHGPAKEARET